MVEWIIDNKDWVFSGIGVAFLTFLFEREKNKAGYKATPLFYTILFDGIVLALGIDYFFNFGGDWRLRLFILGISIIITFISEQAIHRIMHIFSVWRKANELSLEDCEYVIKCYEGNEYFVFNFTNKFEFEAKWDKVLYIPIGQRIVLHKPYKICADKYAYKLVKKRLECGHK